MYGSSPGVLRQIPVPAVRDEPHANRLEASSEQQRELGRDQKGSGPKSHDPQRGLHTHLPAESQRHLRMVGSGLQ